MTRKSIARMSLARVYPLLAQKAERRMRLSRLFPNGREIDARAFPYRFCIACEPSSHAGAFWSEGRLCRDATGGSGSIFRSSCKKLGVVNDLCAIFGILRAELDDSFQQTPRSLNFASP